MRADRLFVGIVGLALPAVASAYSLTGVTWGWQHHGIEDPWEIAADGFPDSAGSSADVVTAVEAAMSSWNAAGVDVRLTSAGASSFDDAAPDGRFAVLFDPGRVSGGTLAYASSWSWDDGAGFDCDITFVQSNDYGTTGWSANPSQALGTDVRAVALHELGHCIGLGHSADSGAVMYAYYSAYRDLRADDVSAATALFGAPCADVDGDGVRSCEGDCRDDDARIFPGSGETCNGVDDDCDGVVDGDEPMDVVLAEDGTTLTTGWSSGANTVVAAEATRLIRIDQRLEAPVGTRLVWTVYEARTVNGPFTLLTSARTEAATGKWQSSPILDLALEAGHRYVIGVGAMADSFELAYEGFASKKTQGPITPVGAVYGRALGDQNVAADSGYLFQQTLVVVASPDPDGDGAASACGDCAPDDAEIFPGQVEACDDVDQDCDGEIDEDFAVDADADGVYDCADVCPKDADDDLDGDGACADVDPCPSDAFDSCDDPGDTDPTGEDPGGDDDLKGVFPGCACDQGGGGVPFGALVAMALVARRRRR